MLKNTENANTFHKQRNAETILFQPQFIPSSHPSNLSYFFPKRAYPFVYLCSYVLLQNKFDSYCKEVFAKSFPCVPVIEREKERTARDRECTQRRHKKKRNGGTEFMNGPSFSVSAIFEYGLILYAFTQTQNLRE